MKKSKLSPKLKIADDFLDTDKFRTDMVLKELDELIVMRELSVEEQIKKKIKR